MTTTPPEDLTVRLRATRFVPAIIRRVAWLFPKLINPDGPEAADRIEQQDEDNARLMAIIIEAKCKVIILAGHVDPGGMVQRIADEIDEGLAALKDTSHG